MSGFLQAAHLASTSVPGLSLSSCVEFDALATQRAQAPGNRQGLDWFGFRHKGCPALVAVPRRGYGFAMLSNGAVRESTLQIRTISRTRKR